MRLHDNIIQACDDHATRRLGPPCIRFSDIFEILGYCLALKNREEIRNKNNNGWGNFRELWPKYLPLAYFYRNIEMYEKTTPP